MAYMKLVMTKAGWAATAILIAGWLAMLAITAPGFLTWDSVSQLASARSGLYNSWHPPVMAWLLGVFDAAVPGTALFLIFQSGLLLAALLALLWSAPRCWFSAVLALAIVALPQWLLFQGEIWKDILFTDSAIAGFAALTLLAQRWRIGWLVAALILLTLAASTRQNGLVLLPVAAVTLGFIARRHGKAAWRHGVGFLVAALVLGGTANWALAARGDGGEGARAQLQTGQAYDLGGALARQPNLPLPELHDAPALDHAMRQASAFYSPLRVDPMAATPVFHAALETAPPGMIAAAWRGLILHHTALYLSVRWDDFHAVLLTPDGFACHYAPVGIDGDPALLKSLRLTPGIRPHDQMLARYAGHFFGTPVYMHLAWAILALLLLVLLLRRRAPADLAVAGLLTSALLFTMTFAIISIACDYRYLLLLDLSAIAAALYLLGTKTSHQK
jgi:hypothetical protein